MKGEKAILITGTRKGIGKYLAEYYLQKGFKVYGCSRGEASIDHLNYRHFSGDVGDEVFVKKMVKSIKESSLSIGYLINNAGVASMNHSLLTPTKTAKKIFDVNFHGAFTVIREVAKVMQKNHFGRIINFTTVAVPLQVEGESIYSASKAALEMLTKTCARELAEFGVTINAIGPTPVATDLIASVPSEKIKALVNRQSIKRLGTFNDVTNVTDFYLSDMSDFITGQVMYLGGVS